MIIKFGLIRKLFAVSPQRDTAEAQTDREREMDREWKGPQCSGRLSLSSSLISGYPFIHPGTRAGRAGLKYMAAGQHQAFFLNKHKLIA